ncbi:MAG: hypothetical protein KAU62_04745, partial [Candidatus Heimdallarchaeota archaeon]|nr:hypothetical protein [Candidatus Heimdallarchaeota archaeon]
MLETLYPYRLLDYRTSNKSTPFSLFCKATHRVSLGLQTNVFNFLKSYHFSKSSFPLLTTKPLSILSEATNEVTYKKEDIHAVFYFTLLTSRREKLHTCIPLFPLSPFKL